MSLKQRKLQNPIGTNFGFDASLVWPGQGRFCYPAIVSKVMAVIKINDQAKQANVAALPEKFSGRRFAVRASDECLRNEGEFWRGWFKDRPHVVNPADMAKPLKIAGNLGLLGRQ